MSKGQSSAANTQPSWRTRSRYASARSASRAVSRAGVAGPSARPFNARRESYQKHRAFQGIAKRAIRTPFAERPMMPPIWLKARPKTSSFRPETGEDRMCHDHHRGGAWSRRLRTGSLRGPLCGGATRIGACCLGIGTRASACCRGDGGRVIAGGVPGRRADAASVTGGRDVGGRRSAC